MIVVAVIVPMAWRSPATTSTARSDRSVEGPESINEIIKAQSEFLDRQLRASPTDTLTRQ